MSADFCLEIEQKLDKSQCYVEKPARPSSSGNSESQRYRERGYRRHAPPAQLLQIKFDLHVAVLVIVLGTVKGDQLLIIRKRIH